MSEKEKPRNPQVDNMRLTKRKSKERRKFNGDLEQEVEVMSNQEMQQYIHNLGKEIENKEYDHKT